MSKKETIYMMLPHFFQNVMVTLFDFLAYRKRHGGIYSKSLSYFKDAEKLTYEQLVIKQEERLSNFLKKAEISAPFYKNLFRKHSVNVNEITLTNLKDLPITTKEDIRKNINEICLDKANKIVSNTGGTTGKSLTVYFSKSDAQERFACLDNFKNRFGWKFGDKTAWFSGKNILNKRDLKKNRYWKTDFLYNIRYYSTFNISETTALFYINNFNKYQPLFFSGFPSSISEIAKIGIRNGLELNYTPKGIFPTAESISEEDKAIMMSFYNCNIFDQYASSEGAPFITQCKNGHMHIELLTGVFEVIDSDGNYTTNGELIVTPFATTSTPLIRYKIGDSIELENKPIDCYLKYPIVKKINGRVNDYLYSEERGKINLGNISNIVKYTNGINKFQIIQDNKKAICVLVVKDENYTLKDEQILLKELKYRLGNVISISFKYVGTIENEKSGKFRIVKNNINI